MDKYNTFGARVAAGIVDGVIFYPLTMLDEYFDKSLYSQKYLFIIWTIFSMSAFQLYTILMHGKYGQTVGKKAMSVKIVTSPEESQINYRHAIIRDSPYIILLVMEILITIIGILSPDLIFNPTISIATYFLGYAYIIWFFTEIITMLFNDKKRALHDIIANTVVIKV